SHVTFTLFIILMRLPPPRSTLFPYTTLFRSESDKDIRSYIKKINLIRKKEICLQKGSYYYLHTSEGITHHAKIFSFARIYQKEVDRKSTRLNSSHVKISYAVFCLKKKKKNYN